MLIKCYNTNHSRRKKLFKVKQKDNKEKINEKRTLIPVYSVSLANHDIREEVKQIN